MSIFRASEFGRKKETVHKVKLPTQAKSKALSICPFCSKKGWSKKLRKCVKCHKVHTPEKDIEWKKFRL
jgi:hypothetical protein